MFLFVKKAVTRPALRCTLLQPALGSRWEEIWNFKVILSYAVSLLSLGYIRSCLKKPQTNKLKN